MAWLCAVEDWPTSNEDGFKALRDPGRFERLDWKLALAVQTLNPPRLLKEEIRRRTAQLQERTDIITGRHTLWLYARWFATTEECGALYGVEDLFQQLS